MYQKYHFSFDFLLFKFYDISRYFYKYDSDGETDMVIFLTSSFITFQPAEEYKPLPIADANGFCNNLRLYWKEKVNFLVIASNPDDPFGNDHVVEELYDAFMLSDFSINKIKCFDSREKESLEDCLRWADVIFLAGGHGPTANEFINRIGLKELINDPSIFDGILIGLSAGSINLAKEAYIIPELPEEVGNPDYVKVYPGLGLTNISMIPHSQYYSQIKINDKNIIYDIAMEDSYSRDFYLIPDGSYFVIRNGVTEFFGYGSIMENGQCRPLHAGIINLEKYKKRTDNVENIKHASKNFESVVSDYYDWVLEYNIKSDKIEFLHISPFMLENDIIPVNIDTFYELIELLAEKLVVDDEKIALLNELQRANILEEISRFDKFVRTFHLKTEQGIKAVNIRISSLKGVDDVMTVCLTDISLVLDHDWMTDVYSRSGFLAQAYQLMKDPKYQKDHSIVYTNIQGFKGVNNLIGRSSSDMVLFSLRDSIMKIMDPLFVGRLENDHFVFFTNTSNLSEENLNKFCNQTYEDGDISLPIKVRCGIYNLEDMTNSVQYMMDQAKLAENNISASLGKYYAICDDKMSKEYVTQSRFITEIDEALENNEFKTFFQPIVDARTGKIVSAEALIRWEHHKFGMIPPGQFIPIFEKEGLISKLDNFMINSVLNFNLDRKKNGKKIVPCAVNLSRVDFYDTKLLETLKNKLTHFEDVQQVLKLEVTESAYAVLEKDAIDFLTEMKKLGLALLLDDFGSGMSSLSTLESFEFDTIKLDMGFIHKIGKSKVAEEIIKHIVGLSLDIGSSVIAEGVENEEQLNFLKEAGCNTIQGYYFYKPMPADEFTKYLDEM